MSYCCFSKCRGTSDAHTTILGASEPCSGEAAAGELGSREKAGEEKEAVRRESMGEVR